ncbi:Transcriptional regulatory protein DegU [bioreactor metagenome]|uniref:Transcriptional regulatory protein DegU n=1 Tax=bioreactor metagenome TaxID=1076179 RepID=A0A645DJG2_9ZZZZ
MRTPQLIAAIHSVAQGDAILTPRVTRQVIERGVPRALPAAQREHIRALFSTLSPREADIARLIADGLSNAEIADRLVIQQASVRRNVSRILAKLGLRDRVQIAVEWYRSGM